MSFNGYFLEIQAERSYGFCCVLLPREKRSCPFFKDEV